MSIRVAFIQIIQPCIPTALHHVTMWEKRYIWYSYSTNIPHSVIIWLLRKYVRISQPKECGRHSLWRLTNHKQATFIPPPPLPLFEQYERMKMLIGLMGVRPRSRLPPSLPINLKPRGQTGTKVGNENACSWFMCSHYSWVRRWWAWERDPLKNNPGIKPIQIKRRFGGKQYQCHNHSGRIWIEQKFHPRSEHGKRFTWVMSSTWKRSNIVWQLLLHTEGLNRTWLGEAHSCSLSRNKLHQTTYKA